MLLYFEFDVELTYSFVVIKLDVEEIPADLINGEDVFIDEKICRSTILSNIGIRTILRNSMYQKNFVSY